MKRLKRVFSSSSDVISLFLRQSQDSARCSNVFFESHKIYSYGYHYLLGVIMEYKGRKVCLVNNSGYSRTTSKHISQLSYKARQVMPVIELCDIKSEHGNDFKALTDCIDSKLQLDLNNLIDGCFDISSLKYCHIQYDIKKHNELCAKIDRQDMTLEAPTDLIKMKDVASDFKRLKRYQDRIALDNELLNLKCDNSYTDGLYSFSHKAILKDYLKTGS